MRIRLLKSWHGAPAGSVHDWGRGVAEILVMRKIAEAVACDTKALDAPPENKAVRLAPRQKRG